jgi:hypothetical protein
MGLPPSLPTGMAFSLDLRLSKRKQLDYEHVWVFISILGTRDGVYYTGWVHGTFIAYFPCDGCGGKGLLVYTLGSTALAGGSCLDASFLHDDHEQ